jgi:hypothetical protein
MQSQTGPHPRGERQQAQSQLAFTGCLSSARSHGFFLSTTYCDVRIIITATLIDKEVDFEKPKTAATKVPKLGLEPW